AASLGGHVHRGGGRLAAGPRRRGRLPGQGARADRRGPRLRPDRGRPGDLQGGNRVGDPARLPGARCLGAAGTARPRPGRGGHGGAGQRCAAAGGGRGGSGCAHAPTPPRRAPPRGGGGALPQAGVVGPRCVGPARPGPAAAPPGPGGGRGPRAPAPPPAAPPAEAVDAALHGMARRLGEAAPAVLAANAADVAAGEAAGLGRGLLDRLPRGEARVARGGPPDSVLAGAPLPPAARRIRDLPGEFFLAERRVPVGVIGANYEARPNVTVDVASQLLKSRNAGVLRTGAAALRSAVALFDHVIAPALTGAGLDAGVLQLVRSADRQAAVELVSRPGLIPLVILRGSGDTTRSPPPPAAPHHT